MVWVSKLELQAEKILQGSLAIDRSSMPSSVFDRMLSGWVSLRRRLAGHSMQVHATTLDEVVSVNSLFTSAIFVGFSLSFPSNNNTTFQTDKSCVPGADTIKYLFVFEVMAFGFFLFSSLVAHGMKLYIVFRSGKDMGQGSTAQINSMFLRAGMLTAALGTVAGTTFLMLSLITIVQLRLGALSCRNGWAEAAIIPLVSLTSVGITVFIICVMYDSFR
ncbi:hypothetical protein O6H91_01G009800 [Diphasiastrum complanatum]|uniref:Uncharacterized protein n=1 Tax=Diphasiastrum complanatum TaxID=34168 RepID=A0ACC2EN87_DIPCM|nr:hypothetical protein O6H91_Y149000 [Diphasiastrum complanatum]KAJ7567850.1 hypothetical protein O6H91_01G009800 [Diphasiastrum complanatum]